MQTYRQTETGSPAITPLGGWTPTKPGSRSLPFFGMDPAFVDPVSGVELHGKDDGHDRLRDQPELAECGTSHAVAGLMVHL